VPTFESGNALDEFFSGLVANRHDSSRTPDSETVKMLGKRAAARHIDGRESLNDSIVELAGEHPDLTREHVKRIVEEANSEVYLHKHAMAEKSGASASAPHFHLANFDEIVSRLDSPEEVKTSSAWKYSGSPPPPTDPFSKLASDRSEAAFREGFGELTEELDVSKEGLIGNVFARKTELTGLKEHLAHAANEFELTLERANDDYYDAVKRHVLGGGSFAEVVTAAQSVGLGAEKTAEVLWPYGQRLVQERVTTLDDIQEDLTGLKKLAHRVINEQHPLVQRFGEISVCQMELEKIAAITEDIDESLKQVEEFIKTNLRS